jgi:hypothetical protein
MYVTFIKKNPTAPLEIEAEVKTANMKSIKSAGAAKQRQTRALR